MSKLRLGESSVLTPGGKVEFTEAGVFEREFSIIGDSILVSLYVESLAGTLDVSVFTVAGDSGGESEIITFPQINAATAELLIRKAAVSLEKCRVVATFSDAAVFRIDGKPITSGETTVTIVGSANARVSQATVDSGAAQPIIPASLEDRQGFVIKNNTQFPDTNILYIGFSASEATESNGYPLYPGEAFPADIQAGAVIFASSTVDGLDARIVEGGQ